MHNDYNTYLDYIKDLSQKGYDKLSIACAYKAADGLILATDSRITTKEHGFDAIETDDGRKYYYSEKYNIGVACVGNIRIQGEFWFDHVIRIENESNDRDDFFRKFQETTEIIYPITQFIIIDPLNDSIMYSDKVSKGLEKLNGYFYHIGQNELIQPHCTIKSIEPEMHIDAAVKRIIDILTSICCHLRFLS